MEERNSNKRNIGDTEDKSIEEKKVQERNCEILFEYLRSILYDPQGQTLDINELDEPFQKLGMGLKFLDKAVREMKAYSAALSRGDLSSIMPARDNFLCENLKNIHANLNHLTWQAKQVAKGDYSQTVSYLGEFSEAFNTMTEQLREREESLKRIAEEEKLHAEKAESYSQLLMAEAHMDTLTKIGNRFFFQEKADELLKSGQALAFCYCDLDHLKYVNDNYGHGEGDWYLRYFVHTVKSHIRKRDIFARIGGDEFGIILVDCTRKDAEERIQGMQKEFAQETTRNYLKNFSCGIIEVAKDHEEMSLEQIMEEADSVMYKQKRAHKKVYEKSFCQ